MGCFVRGGRNGMGCFVRGGKNGMGCFVRGGKSLWDVLSRVSKNGMGCFVPGCFVLHSCITGEKNKMLSTKVTDYFFVLRKKYVGKKTVKDHVTSGM